MAGPSRIPLQWPLNNRDGTFNKDVRLSNVMAERDGQTSKLMKRPGTSSIVYSGTSVGQGLGNLNDLILAVSGDRFQILSAPPNSGTSMTALGAKSPLPWPSRADNGYLTFGGRMWILGGNMSGTSGAAADVWSSVDGTNWAQATGAAPWGSRAGAKFVVLAGLMYVVGGRMILPNGTLGDYMNDVWSSEDGSEWIQVTTAAPWNPRNDFSLTVTGSGMFLIGGSNQFFPAFDDVWFSAEGKDWTRLGGPFPWAARTKHSTLWFQNKLFLIAGANGASVTFNDVWSSPNGVQWTQETAAAFPAARAYQAAVVYADRMWVIGGATPTGSTGEIYQSTATGAGAWILVSNITASSQQRSATVFGAPPSSGQGRYPTIWFTPGVQPPSSYISPSVVFYGHLDVTLGANTNLNPPVSSQPFTFNAFNTATRLLIKCESGLWVYDSGTLTRVTDTGYPATTVPGLVVLGGFAYVMDISGLIYNCALDNPYYWPALNVLGADYEEDRGVALLKYLNYIVALGENTIQLFYDSGLQYGSPLKPYLNANARIGCCNKYTAMRVGNNVAWLSQTAERQWQVMMLEGVSPKAISTPYIEKILETQAFSIPSARGFVIEVPGHLFYGLAFGTTGAGFSLVFDFTTGDWFEWTNGAGGPYYYSGHTPRSSAGSNAPNLVQDFASGNVRAVSPTIYQDNGTTPFPVYIRTGKVDNTNNRSKFWGRMDVIGDQNPGLPTISFTDDDYQTYSTPRPVNMALLRPVLFRNGSSRRRAWVYEQLDNNPMRVESIEHTFEQGT